MTLNKILLFAISIFLSIGCYAQEILPSILPDSLNVANRQWKLGFKDENDRGKIGEYVSNEENINNWTELLTFQKFKFAFPKEVTPVTFADKEIADLKTKEYKYVYTVFESSSQEAIVEVRVISPANIQQDKLQRIIKTSNDELIVLNYAIKKEDMGEAERSKWVSGLKGIEMSLFQLPQIAPEKDDVKE